MIEPAGDIKNLTIPWLLQDLRKEGRTGTVSLASEQAVKKIFFSSGEIIYAASNLPDDQLITRLLREGKITQQYFDATNEIIKKKPGKSTISVLIEFDFIAKPVLEEAAAVLAKQVVLSVFGWRSGRYIFDDGPLPLADIISLRMDTGALIVEGVQSLDWQSVRKSLPSLKTVLLPGAEPAPPAQLARMEPDCHAVLALINGTLSIEELCARSGIGDFNTLQSVFRLLALRMVRTGAEKTEQQMKAARAAAPETAQKPPEKPAAAAPPADDVPLSKEQIEQAYQALRHQDNYQVLGIADKATTSEIKKAYFKLAKAYHPDRHLAPEMANLKSKFESLFTAIHNAYQTLSDPAKRQEYDKLRTGRKAEAPSGAQFEEKHAEEYVENYAEKTGQAAAFYQAGMKDFKIGNFWGAAEAFTSAARLDPVKADYYYYLGLSLARIPRRRHEAEEKLQKAIEIDPLKIAYRLELGALYLKSGLKTKALAVYAQALEQDPSSEEVKKAITAAGGSVPTAPDENAQAASGPH